MSKQLGYKGSGVWILNVRLQEILAQQVYSITQRRGITGAELVRSAIADYIDKDNGRK